MARRFVDLSIYLENAPRSDPPPRAPKITYQTHKDTIKEFVHLLPGTQPEDFPDGEAAAAKWVTLTTHNRTHLDALYHFHSTMNKGERSITIDEVPLEWCFQPGVELDFRHLPDGQVVSAAQVAEELARVGHDLQPLEIIVVNTRAGSRYGHDFVNAGCGMGYEATMYLLERGVRLTGTDAWSWDAPFSYTAKKFAALGRTQGRPRYRILPLGEAAQFGSAACGCILYQLFPPQDTRCLGRLDPRSGHF